MQQRFSFATTTEIDGLHYFDVTDVHQSLLASYRDPLFRRTIIERNARLFAPFAQWVEFEYLATNQPRVAVPLRHAIKTAVADAWMRFKHANLLTKLGIASLALLWLATLALVTSTAPKNMEVASEALEAIGAATVMVGTVWIGAGVALSAPERRLLTRLRQAKVPIMPDTFDIADTLLTTSRRCMEGTYIVAVGTVFLLAHVVCAQLHNIQTRAERNEKPTDTVATRAHSIETTASPR
jgi:hypothetical protein